jgi:dihydroorotase
VEAVEEGAKNGWIEGEVSQEVLEGFLSGYGGKFYKLENVASKGHKQRIILEKKGERISQEVRSEDGAIEVVPFRSGEETLSLRWK